MRIRVELRLDRPIALPINHQHLLAGVIYSFLQRGDEEYAHFLHDEGYLASEDERDHRRFKLFVHSPMRSKRRRVAGSVLQLGPGKAEWLVSSPIDDFLTAFAVGLMASGELDLGRVRIPIALVQTLAAPVMRERMRFTCVSPMVVSVTDREEGVGRTRYLVAEDAEFSERVRQNLLAKYAAMSGGKLPADDRFMMRFDADYLAKRRGTKLVEYKGIRVRGMMAPFEAWGSPALMEVGYHAGFGEKNAGGFGMVEVENG
ncbi:MAG: CRISPR-associated endoribonuclease Cas6 [Chthonomonadales bacterium]